MTADNTAYTLQVNALPCGTLIPLVVTSYMLETLGNKYESLDKLSDNKSPSALWLVTTRNEIALVGISATIKKNRSVFLLDCEEKTKLKYNVQEDKSFLSSLFLPSQN